jgi:hypothetical protein
MTQKGLSQKSSSIQKTGEFTEPFGQQDVSEECLRLLGVNIRIEQGKKLAIENNLFNTRCVELVQSAYSMLNKVLD